MGGLSAESARMYVTRALKLVFFSKNVLKKNFLSSADVFLRQLFPKHFFQDYHPSQTVWIQIRNDVLSGLIWVQTVC